MLTKYFPLKMTFVLQFNPIDTCPLYIQELHPAGNWKT